MHTRTVALIPAMLLLGAVGRYAQLRSATSPSEHSAFALAIAAAAAFGGSVLVARRRIESVRRTTREILEVIAGGAIGIGIPALILAWSRGILNSNAGGILLAAPVALLAVPFRRSRTAAVAGAALLGSLLLIVGRTAGIGFTPVRAAYLSVVSGAVIDLARAATALGALMVAGVAAALFYRRVGANDAYARPASVALLLAPAAAMSMLYATLFSGLDPGNLDVWSLVSGVCVAVHTAAVVVLVRRTTPLLGATAALTTFLPAVIVTSRVQGAALTSTMRVGAVLVIATVVLLRKAVRETADGAFGTEEDR